MAKSQSGKGNSDGGIPEIDQDIQSWAFRFACDVHRRQYDVHRSDRVLARKIVSNALDKYRRLTKADNRRGARPLTARSHRNIVIQHPHVRFQRCVYEASEEFELIQEEEHWKGNYPLSQEDLLIRFLKKLVLTGLQINIFYLTNGLLELLHRYTWQETASVYFALVQYSHELRRDTTFWRAKARVMDILEGRFNTVSGEFLTIEDGPRNRRCYLSVPASEQTQTLTEYWLSRLMPRLPSVEFPKTCAEMPPPNGTGAQAERLQVAIPALATRGNEPDDEYFVEPLRLHALLHAECLSALITTLGLKPLRSQRTIPLFNLHKDGGGSKMSLEANGGSSNLTEDDLEEIRKDVQNKAAKRKVIHPRWLTIEIDGRPTPTQFDVYSSHYFPIDIDEGTIGIEVKGRKDDVLIPLAVNWLRWPLRTGQHESELESVVLEGGQRLEFSVSYKIDPIDETVTGACVSIGYYEENRSRALILAIRRLIHKRWFRTTGINHASGLLTYSVLTVLLAVSTGMLMILMGIGRAPTVPTSNPIVPERQSPQDDAYRIGKSGGEATTQSPSAEPGISVGDGHAGSNSELGRNKEHTSAQTTTEEQTDSRQAATEQRTVKAGNQSLSTNSQPLQNIPNDRKVNDIVRQGPDTAANLPPSESGFPSSDTTRSANKESKGVQILEVRRVYIDSQFFSETEFDRELYAMLSGPHGLKKVARFTLSQVSNDADAVIRGSVEKLSTGWKVSVRLVNKQGETIWPGVTVVSTSDEHTAASEAADNLMRSLNEFISAAEKSQKEED